MAKDLDSHSGRSDRKWSDGVQKWEWPQRADWCAVRFYGPVWSDYRHSVTTKNNNVYPEYCHAYDVDNDRHHPDKEQRCELCRLSLNDKRIKGGYRYFSNLISIKHERERPANPDPAWSPLYMIEIAPTLLTQIQKLKPLNQGYSVSDINHGAIIQVKYDAKAEAASMYSASMDTKDVKITADQLLYLAIQTDPFGERHVHHAEGGRPAMFTYFRGANTPDETKRSLRVHGYYGSEPGEMSQGNPYSNQPSNGPSRVAATALAPEPTHQPYQAPAQQVQQQAQPYQAPVQVSQAQISQVSQAAPVVSNYQAPAPAAQARGDAAASAPDALKASVFQACTTAFGEFARAPECFMKCKARNECREETDRRKAGAAHVTKVQGVQPGVDDIA